MPIETVSTPQTAMAARGVIPEQPDINTVELATYGKEYLDVKSVLYLIDMMIEIAQRDYEKTIAGCVGRQYELVSEILRRKPFSVSQEKPHVENLEELQAGRRAKQIYRAASTVRTLEMWRVEVETYGSLEGAYEYGQAMTEMGVSADIMRRVFKKRASQGKVNTYASVRDQREGMLNAGLSDEDRALARMAEMILTADEYERMMREYPEDDSADKLIQQWSERIAPKLEPQAPGPVDDDEEEEDVDFDMGAVGAVPKHVGADFVAPDELDEGEVIHEGPIEFDDGALDVSPEAPPEKASIPPVASSVSDAMDMVPPPERLRLGPGTPDEVQHFFDAKYGRIERLPPVMSSLDDALDSVQAVMRGFIATSRRAEFEKWYGMRSLLSDMDLMEFGVEDDGGFVVVMAPHDEESDV